MKAYIVRTKAKGSVAVEAKNKKEAWEKVNNHVPGKVYKSNVSVSHVNIAYVTCTKLTS